MKKDELIVLNSEQIFEHRHDVNEEIKRRAQKVLRESGYDWYKMNNISVVTLARGSVTIVGIQADVEHNFQQLSYTLEIPIKVFETLST
jgi:hypothetical protein